MSDELLLRRLRANASWGDDRFSEAADRIEQLTAERDRLNVSNMQMLGDIAVAMGRVERLTAELADAEALIEAQAKDHASNNIRFAEAEHRAKVAEAERDRLREALIELIQQTHNCERELTEDLHHVDFCGESVPLTNAREALKGESYE